MFNEYDLRTVVEDQEKKIKEEIASYDPNRLLNTPNEDLIEFFYNKLSINPLRLLEDHICVDQKETQIDISRDPSRFIYDRSRPVHIQGTAIILEVPFTGDVLLFKCRASTFNLNPPMGEIREKKLFITVETLDHNSESIKKELDKGLHSIKEYINWISIDVNPWNNTLSQKIQTWLTSRKDKLLKDRGLVSSLGFPMKTREDAYLTYAAPDVRRKSPVIHPNTNTHAFKPEPVLGSDDYEHILSIINKTALMLERSPQTFRGMGEEQLRDQFLVPLNSHYEGQTTGETFNFNGKTDILIKAQERNIFVAECKIWRGQKSLSDALDQLLGYSTWRDTKTALIIFNRNKELTSVLNKIPETVKNHSHYKREIRISDETNFKYVFSHRDDKSRELTLTILVFEVPQ
ncbi:hypothetical protein [Paenibacillus endoradicis]|uniref:hypothetical protein n=1 Tax=Paenibacillus endoradicis TaxID=2972487 RepID=UPI002158D091|nr:hypothetical protein [Paenibacillus endoradicis]